MPTPFALVMTTCGDKANAQLVAKSLVEKRLAACVQMFAIESVFRWDGAVQNAQELMLFCKIKSVDYTEVEALIRAAHNYENPEIIEIAIENGAPAYLDWIAACTRGEKS